MPQLLTVAEVAELCRCDNQTVIRWIKAGKLRGAKAGNKWLISRDALAVFLGALRPDPTPEMTQAGVDAYSATLAAHYAAVRGES